MVFDQTSAVHVNMEMREYLEEARKVARAGIGACADSTARTHFEQAVQRIEDLQRFLEQTRPLLNRTGTESDGICPPVQTGVPTGPATATLRPDHLTLDFPE